MTEDVGKFGVRYNHNGGGAFEGYYVEPNPYGNTSPHFDTWQEAAVLANEWNKEQGFSRRNGE